MNKVIKLKRGLELPIDGAAAQVQCGVCAPAIFKVIPDHYADIRPKLVVKEGERVLAGQALFHDKVFAEMNFVSPVSGTIKEIVRGERRKVMSINIEADAQTEFKQFETGGDIKTLLLESGLWAYIKQRPYDCIAMPNKTPKAVFISTFDTAPLAPNYEWLLGNELPALQSAIDALRQIAPVFVGVRKGSSFMHLQNCEIYIVDGIHPAGNVGVQINHINPVNKGEQILTLNIQDAAVIGRFMMTGKVNMMKTIALTGPLVYTPQYYRVLPGMPVDTLLKCNLHKEVKCRMVNGNVLSGHQMNPDEVIDPYLNQITVLAEGDDANEFMGWAMPRFSTFSASNTFFSKCISGKLMTSLFGKPTFHWDARLLGGRRAIIVSGEYDKVFPMDIYPEYLIKAMIASDINKMEELGIYEVAPEDFALCEYVCTSKMPLQAIVRQSLDYLKKEIE